MIQGKWFPPGSDLSSVLPVREAVFGRGADGLDPLSWNVLVYMDSEAAASGRIWWQDGVFWLGDICVIESCRRRRLGDLVLRLLLYKAQDHAAREIRLRCPPDTVGFFSRLGFHEHAAEDSLIEMMIEGANVNLDTCSNCPKRDCPDRHC